MENIQVAIVGAKRTAIGNFNGTLATLPAHKLGEAVIRQLLTDAKVGAEEISEVIIGQVLTAGCGQNPARQAAIGAGLPAAIPAWMVNHPNHVCYMLHRLRGLYDTYAPTADDSAVLGQPKLRGLVEWMSDAGGRYPDPEQIPELFDKLRALKDAGLPDSVFAFPGPLIRAIVHFLDNAALSPQRMRRYATIAATVRKRKGYFPADAVVDVLYPPPHRNDYRDGESRYLFTSSRLDRPKRVDLIIEAMKHVTEDIPLLIAGTGHSRLCRLRHLYSF